MKKFLWLLSGTFVASFCAVMFMPGIVHAGLQSSIIIDQISPKDLGTWTFFSADETPVTSKDKGVDPKHYAFSTSVFGLYTLSVLPPAGMSSRISIYHNGQIVSTRDARQMVATLYPGESYRFVVQYALTNVGSIGITTTPSNVPIRLTGPDKKTYNGISPYTFTNLPAGRYTIQASAVPGYELPSPYNRLIEAYKRTTLHIDLPKSDSRSTVNSSVGVNYTRPTKRSIQQSVEIREAVRATQKQNP